MTDVDVEGTAQALAAQGRDALLEKLRPAFHEAARQHADVLELSDAQIEEMVQRAADRADGLQWRRALATVATERLGLSLGQALTHPAVARAQEMLGVPSYEESLAQLRAGRPGAGTKVEGAVPAAAAEEPATAVSEQPADAVTEPPADGVTERPGGPGAEEPADPLTDPPAERVAEEPIAVEHEATDPAPARVTTESPGPSETTAETPREPADATPPPDDAAGELEAPAAPVPPASAPGVVRLSVVHVGGIANLEPDEENIELRLSRRGLDVLRGGGDVLGRLAWREIRALDVVAPRGLGRRRRRSAQLVVRTRQGEASFAVPELSADELRQHLSPMLERYRPRRR